ncbi:MAG: hypothetical protein JWR12_584 [Mucilaginibacter sp.]|nr:hypothetical protein [Mucilaginibacter sp.]
MYKFFPNINDKDIKLSFNKDIKLDLVKTDVGHKSIIFNGYYELNLTKDILKYASEGGLLVDVGANYGYFSSLWASVNARNKVIAFEASPANVGPLKNNISKNGLDGQVTVVPMAMEKN